MSKSPSSSSSSSSSPSSPASTAQAQPPCAEAGSPSTNNPVARVPHPSTFQPWILVAPPPPPILQPPPPPTRSPPPRHRRHSTRMDDSALEQLPPLQADHSSALEQDPQMGQLLSTAFSTASTASSSLPSPPSSSSPSPPSSSSPPGSSSQVTAAPAAVGNNEAVASFQPIQWGTAMPGMPAESPRRFLSGNGAASPAAATPIRFQSQHPGFQTRVDFRATPRRVLEQLRTPSTTPGSGISGKKKSSARVLTWDTPPKTASASSASASEPPFSPSGPRVTPKNLLASGAFVTPPRTASSKKRLRDENEENISPLRRSKRLQQFPSGSSLSDAAAAAPLVVAIGKQREQDAAVPVLPLEVWVNIFSYLQRSEIAVVIQVCRTWYDAVHMHGDCLDSFQQHVPQARGIVPASFLQKALKSGVQNMFLPTMVIRDDLPVGSFAPSSFPSLHRLNLNESRAPLSFMTRFVASLSSLRWIDLYACRVVTDDVVDAIAASSPLLQHANLSGTDITAVGVNNLLQSAPLLETLFVAWCPNLTGKRKPQLSYKGPYGSIKALDVSGCSMAVLHGAQLVSQCPNVQYLGVNDCADISHLVEHIPRLNKLEKLSMNRSYQLDRQQLLTMLNTIPSLRELSVVGFSQAVLEMLYQSELAVGVHIIPENSAAYFDSLDHEMAVGVFTISNA